MTDQTPEVDEQQLDKTPDVETANPADSPIEQHDDNDAGANMPAEVTAALRKARREARNLRDRLTLTEAELAAANTTVKRLTRARAEEIAVDMGLIDGSELWRDGATIDDLRGRNDNDEPTGGLDPARVKATVNALASERPYLRRKPWQPRNNEHLTYAQRMAFGVEPAPDADEQEWADYQRERVKHLRSGLSSSESGGFAATWDDALKRRY